MADVIIIREAAASPAFHPRFALAKMRFRILFAHPGHVLLSSCVCVCGAPRVPHYRHLW